MVKKSQGKSGEISKEIVTALLSRKLSFLLAAFFLCSLTPISEAFVIPSIHHQTRKFSSKKGNSNGWNLYSSSGSQYFAPDLRVPRHVAVICDGNSRWAKNRCLPTAVGHIIGADRFVELIEYLQADGIQYCTFFGFSTENWKRSEAEIQSIFELMEQLANRFANRFPPETSEIEIRLLGDLDDTRIPEGLRAALRGLQDANEKRRLALLQSSITSTPMTVNLAINYGGRQDILRATKLLAIAVKDGKIENPDDITEEVFASFLGTAGTPDPDMIIRTSGESRLSNFLLWNCAYSEIYIARAMWPDFNRDCWEAALAWYQQRQRRFGSREPCEERVRFNIMKKKE
ncbi:unnamed protein product [Cylindrotheca closterium]|uniref:Alkyl transferase n=1 Tax=Cylindrotheca closterium TaxID=2856 RepID=A0AAD2GCM7_9STRA|nr:unnamed protein product [Cylindrotheca closterium]